MTTRERLNKTRSRGALIAVTGLLMCLGAAIAQNTHRDLSMALGFVGFSLFGGSLIYVTFTGRCVHCQQRICQQDQALRSATVWQCMPTVSVLLQRWCR